MNAPLNIPEQVRRKALAAGTAGERWLAGLERTVEQLARAWHLALGRVLPGGTEAFVVEARLRDGRAAVLKVRPPEPTTAAREFQTLLAAGGRGYAAVYAYDAARAAVLLERLGPPLAELGLSVDRQIAIMCETLSEAWAPPLAGTGFMTGAQKAQSLIDFIAATWQELGQPCAAQVIDIARRYAAARSHAFDLRDAVLAHGDAHAWNTLLVPGTAAPHFKLIDPEGLVIERAYDLAISMREWTADLLAGDPVSLGIERCRSLARLSGVDPAPIWQWGFLERTSTGLLCMQLGLDDGRAMLTVAERWAQSLEIPWLQLGSAG